MPETPLKSTENRRPRDYTKSGLFALQRGLQGVGLAWLADTGELAKPLQAWRAETREALGGDSISPQRSDTERRDDGCPPDIEH